MTDALQTGGQPPGVGDVARQVMGAMVADPNNPPDGFGKAIVQNDKGATIYVLAIILGDENAEKTYPLLQQIQALTGPATDVFAEDGEPKAKKKKKRKRRKPQSFRPSRRSPH